MTIKKTVKKKSIPVKKKTVKKKLSEKLVTKKKATNTGGKPSAPQYSICERYLWNLNIIYGGSYGLDNKRRPLLIIEAHIKYNKLDGKKIAVSVAGLASQKFEDALDEFIRTINYWYSNTHPGNKSKIEDVVKDNDTLKNRFEQLARCESMQVQSEYKFIIQSF